MNRKRLYEILETDRRDGLSTATNSLLMTLIVANVVAVVLESDPAFLGGHEQLFDQFELVSVAIFTAEYLTRTWASVEDPRYQHPVLGRLRYMLSPMAFIDLLAILPFYLGMFVSLDARALRALRLLRMFKLSRHFAALGVLLQVIRNEQATLLSAIFVMLIMIILASAGIYYVERDIQPAVFGTIPRAMWWAVVTLTTVGYGDVVPATPAGRLFGVLVTILGVGMAALPAGIIASGFSSELARRRDEYRLAIRGALADGVLTRSDRRALEHEREELGLSSEEADMLAKKEAAASAMVAAAPAPTVCPHCGKPVT